MSSPPAPKMLAHEALLTFDLAIGLIQRIDAAAKGGDQTNALRALSELTAALTAERPVLRGVIRAQEQAAQALHLSQSPSVRVLASIGVPQPHPDAANSHAAPPHQPTPGVA